MLFMVTWKIVYKESSITLFFYSYIIQKFVKHTKKNCFQFYEKYPYAKESFFSKAGLHFFLLVYHTKVRQPSDCTYKEKGGKKLADKNNTGHWLKEKKRGKKLSERNNTGLSIICS